MFSVIIAVGPGPHEMERTIDLARQLERFEQTSLGELLIVDDTNRPKTWDSLQSRFPFIGVIKSVRCGRGDSWRGGPTVNVLAGMNAAFRRKPVSFVLKADTDTFILRSFSQELFAMFAGQPLLGLIGSGFRVDVNGENPGPSTWQVNLRKWLKLFRLRRNPLPHVETALWGRHRFIRRLIKQALSHGWPLGACVQGGGYAISRRVYDLWEQNDMCEDPLLWIGSDLTEDVVVSMMTYAVGLQIVDYNQPNEVFGVKYIGLACPVRELKQRNYAVIHSLKANSWEEEKEAREILSQ